MAHTVDHTCRFEISYGPTHADMKEARHHHFAPVLAAVALSLAACGPERTAAGHARATADELADGQAVYQRACAPCHQPNGTGVAGAFPPFEGSPRLAEADPGKLIRIVLHGLQGPIEDRGKTYNSMMPAGGSLLTNREIALVLTYTRDKWGNGAPPVTEAAVAEVRDTVQRPTPWTWAELNPP